MLLADKHLAQGTKSLMPTPAPTRPAHRWVEPRACAALHRAHFAFMRAVLEGLDPVRSWERYLAAADARVDLRLVRATLQWIRDEFAAAALRERRPGTARLVLMDVQRIFQAPQLLPSLAAFAEEAGLEDYSQAEQVAAYEAHYEAHLANQAGHQRGRQRLLKRQLEALRWLETLVSKPPSKTDPLRSWLHPQLSVRLETAGLNTLGDLVTHIQGRGAHWTRGVPGLGRVKARRIVDWLRIHEVALGSPLGAHVDVAPANWSAQLRQGIQASGFEVRPLEKLCLPEALLGREGGNRADRALNQLAADEDVAAITAWLAQSARRTPGPGGPDVTGHCSYTHTLTHTQRAYRREAERLLLWSTLQRSKAFSSLDQQDAQAYFDFLTHPVPSERWCSAQVHGRWSPLWRPFAGPLSDSSRAHTLRVLCSLFSFLVKQGYLREAIFTRTDRSLLIPTQAPATTAPKSPAKNSLPFDNAQMSDLPVLPDLPDNTTDTQLRLHLACMLTHAGDLRLSQLCELRLCDWQADPSEAGAWRLVQASGTPHKTPRHPVRLFLRLSANTMQWVRRYLETRGLPTHLGVPCHPDIHLIGASPRAPSLRNKPRHAPGDRIQPGTLRDQIRGWRKH